MLIDLHNHMAWDIDDGIQSKEQAEKSLQNASRDGIKKIVATPHYVPGIHGVKELQHIQHRVSELRQLAKKYDVEVYEGSEVFLNHDYLDMIEAKTCKTIHESRYLLVEFDVRKDMNANLDAEEMLYELQIRNYIPLIAHVERYFHSGLDLKRISGWIADGCVIQVNRTSILGLHGERCEQHAHQLLKAGMVHVVASDAHRVEGSRICMLSDVVSYLTKRYGVETAQLLCEHNPNHILMDEDIISMSKKRPGLIQRLRKR